MVIVAKDENQRYAGTAAAAAAASLYKDSPESCCCNPTSKVKVPNYLTEEVLVRIIEGASAKRSQDQNPES